MHELNKLRVDIRWGTAVAMHEKPSVFRLSVRIKEGDYSTHDCTKMANLLMLISQMQGTVTGLPLVEG